MYTGHILPKKHIWCYTYNELLYKDWLHKGRPEYKLNTSYIWTLLSAKLLLVEKNSWFYFMNFWVNYMTTLIYQKIHTSIQHLRKIFLPNKNTYAGYISIKRESKWKSLAIISLLFIADPLSDSLGTDLLLKNYPCLNTENILGLALLVCTFVVILHVL